MRSDSATVLPARRRARGDARLDSPIGQARANPPRRHRTAAADARLSRAKTTVAGSTTSSPTHHRAPKLAANPPRRATFARVAAPGIHSRVEGLQHRQRLGVWWDCLRGAAQMVFGSRSRASAAAVRVPPRAVARACPDGEIEARIAARSAARRAKNWAESDRIRDELFAAGVVLEDKSGGKTAWRRGLAHGSRSGCNSSADQTLRRPFAARKAHTAGEKSSLRPGSTPPRPKGDAMFKHPLTLAAAALLFASGTHAQAAPEFATGNMHFDAKAMHANADGMISKDAVHEIR